MSTALSIQNLNYKRNRRVILHDGQLTLSTGKIVGLLGENGAGKTTLMRLITGNAQGQGVIKVGDSSDIMHRKQKTSFSDHLKGFDKSTKINQVVKFYQTVYPDFSNDRYQEMATFLQLDASQKLTALSKGTKEKLIIALTLARQTELYLLDEPFSGIDSMSRKQVISSILKWTPDNATLLISDHYVHEIASLLDEIVVVKDQTIAVHKGADEIRDQLGVEIEDYYESLYEVGGAADDK